MTASDWLDLFSDLQDQYCLRQWSWILHRASLQVFGRRAMLIPKAGNDN